VINLLVTLLVLVLVFGLIWWLFTSIVTLPAPFAKVAQVLIAVIFIVLLLGIVFGGVDVPVMRLR
jgi:hypothetical protein